MIAIVLLFIAIIIIIIDSSKTREELENAREELDKVKTENIANRRVLASYDEDYKKYIERG